MKAEAKAEAEVCDYYLLLKTAQMIGVKNMIFFDLMYASLSQLKPNFDSSDPLPPERAGLFSSFY